MCGQLLHNKDFQSLLKQLYKVRNPSCETYPMAAHRLTGVAIQIMTIDSMPVLSSSLVISWCTPLASMAALLMSCSQSASDALWLWLYVQALSVRPD